MVVKKKSFWLCYQKDFYSLNYNLRLTLPLSATIMGNVVRIRTHHSFHKHIFHCLCSHFFSNSD